MRKEFIVATVFVAGSIASASVYNESVDGDLSNDRFNPTLIDFDTGMNMVTMEVVDSDQPNGDLDYFTFTLDAGESVDSIVVIDSSNPAGGFDAAAFVGLAFDSFFDFDPATFMGDGVEGFVITSPDQVGIEQISILSDGLSSLGPGDYTFWVQQTGVDLTSVTLGVNVVPTPGALALLGMGGLMAGRRRR